MQTSIDLEFADGVYTFKLGLAQIEEIENKCGCGLGEVFSRVLAGRFENDGEFFGHPAHARWKMVDLIETIRQGLLGGGLKANIDGVDVTVSGARANELIRNYVADRPKSEAWSLAAAILTAAIEGYSPPKKDMPARRPAKPRAKRTASSGPKGSRAR